MADSVQVAPDPVDLGDKIDQAARELAEIIDPVLPAQKKLDEIGTKVDAILTLNDEQRALIEMIHTNSSQAHEALIPKLLENSERLKRVFTMIDTLESVVERVGEGIEVMEAKADEVSSHVKPTGLLSSFFAKPKVTDPEQLPDLKLLEPVFDTQALLADLHIKTTDVSSNMYLQQAANPPPDSEVM